MIYLDYAAHTPADEAVLAAYCEAERNFMGNPSSAHGLGRAAAAELSRATVEIAELVCAAPNEIIFTSGATEANNLAIKGIARAYAHRGRHILSTPLEHPSASGALAHLAAEGFEIELLKITPDGTIDLAALESAIRADTILLAVSAVDSEIGAIQPIGDIAKIIASHENCRLHIDAAQAIGKLPIPDSWLAAADTFCFTPHKFYGLLGCGVLVKRAGVVLEPLIHGGAGATLYRGGTQSVAAAVACCEALRIAVDNQAARLTHVRGVRDYVIRGLSELSERGAVLVNSPADGSPYILNISILGYTGSEIQQRLDECGIAVSVKTACSTDTAPSKSVLATSGNRKRARSAFRVSFGYLTGLVEVEAVVGCFKSKILQIAN